MEITQTNPANPVQTVNKSTTKISSDFDTFLKLLTAQVKNQDPLNPMDSSDFSTQLATFSGVEQQVQTNDLLKSLGTQMSNLGMGQLASWIGMEARTSQPVGFVGDALTLLPKFDSNATRADLVVRNSLGTEVQRIAVDKSQTNITWRGTNDLGNLFPDGVYQFSIENFDGDDLITTNPAESYAKITEAKITDGKTILVLTGGAEINSTGISALRQSAG